MLRLSASICILALLACTSIAHTQEYFAVQVRDAQSGRGLPLVKLRVGDQEYYTDSNGLVALNSPGLLNQNVTFAAASYGYQDSNATLQTTPGTTGELTLTRSQRAERLYRVTGKGIYQDTVQLGLTAPIAHPLLNANVKGQDSVQSVVYNGQIHWFWGDTLYDVGFGNFRTAGATSQLPGAGGLSPAVGVDLNYYVDAGGSAKQMMPLTQPGPVWIDGLFTVADNTGREWMMTHYSRRDPNNVLGGQVEHGLARFNDSQAIFQRFQTYALDAPIAAAGHSFEREIDGQEYIYFAESYPNIRVKKNWNDVTTPAAWEAFTPLKENSRYNAAVPPLDLDEFGKPIYGWKKNTNPLTTEMLEELVNNGHIVRDESPFRMKDYDNGEIVRIHRSSVYWNEYRNSWVMIGNEFFGDSFLGEVYFSEAPTPEGPWEKAIKIATHHSSSENYTFYNPKQHPFFAEQNGRIIYFEGTYAETFSGNPNPTPLYDYNQMMYRLDLATLPLMFERLVGDYNLDGVVDAADYTVWQDTFGSSTDLRANGDNSGASFQLVDEADYSAWRANFGTTIVAGSASSAGVQLPEPQALASAVIWLGVLVQRRRSPTS
jgi:hypothetical protein